MTLKLGFRTCKGFGDRRWCTSFVKIPFVWCRKCWTLRNETGQFYAREFQYTPEALT